MFDGYLHTLLLVFFSGRNSMTGSGSQTVSGRQERGKALYGLSGFPVSEHRRQGFSQPIQAVNGGAYTKCSVCISAGSVLDGFLSR